MTSHRSVVLVAGVPAAFSSLAVSSAPSHAQAISPVGARRAACERKLAGSGPWRPRAGAQLARCPRQAGVLTRTVTSCAGLVMAASSTTQQWRVAEARATRGRVQIDTARELDRWQASNGGWCARRPGQAPAHLVTRACPPGVGRHTQNLRRAWRHDRPRPCRRPISSPATDDENRA